MNLHRRMGERAHGSRMRPLLWLALLALAPAASAHAGPHDALEPLSGEVMSGALGKPQQGALVVVPLTAGAVACAAGGVTVPVGEAAHARLLANATHLAVTIEATRTGFAAAAVDTGVALRTLLLMQEAAMAMHRLRAHVGPAGSVVEHAGWLGVAHEIEGSGHGHDLGMSVEGEMMMTYDDDAGAPAAPCDDASRPFLFARGELATLEAGRVAHLVLLHDARLPAKLPRPIEGTTAVAQLNAYLPDPDDDPRRLHEALSSRAHPSQVLPFVLGLAAALVAVVLPSRR